MHYVVAYDVAQTRRRTKIMNKLKDHGLRVQFSVFECEMDPPRMDQLKSELLPLMNLRQDRLHIYRLCETCFLRSENHGAAERAS